jgi:hypothetical protein
MSFKNIATPLIECGIRAIPLRPRTKEAFLSGWEDLASTDVAQIDAWNAQDPNYNCGAVAKAELDTVWFFEFDSGEVANRVYADTNKKLPPTFKVQSSPGRGHLYFKQSAASITMGNLSQSFVKFGDWSARVHNQYVVAPGSIHPKTGLPYEIMVDVKIVEAPDWFVNWCVSQKLDKKTTIAQFTTGQGEIPEHFRNDVLTSIGGGLREKGLIYDEILMVLSRTNQERCNPPLPDSEVQTISNSVSRYVAGDPVAGMVLTYKNRDLVKNPITDAAQEELRSRIKDVLNATAQTVEETEPRITVLNTMANLRALDYLLPGFPQQLTKKSLWGLMGDFVEIAYPTTVASREMILFQALPALGVVAGKKFYAPFGADRHYGTVWTLNIARTADGKGSVKNIVLSALKVMDDYVSFSLRSQDQHCLGRSTGPCGDGHRNGKCHDEIVVGDA